jgi:hypothetical protein
MLPDGALGASVLIALAANCRDDSERMTVADPDREQSESTNASRITRIAVVSSIWILVIVAGACLFRVGIQLRHWAWDECEHMHFVNDVSRALMWGTRADQEGVLNLYRSIREEYGDAPPQEYGLDYAPLRLLIATRWAHWVNQRFDASDEWDPEKSYAFHRPLLMLNAACEAATAVGVVLVLRLMWGISRGEVNGPAPRAWDRVKEILPLVLAAVVVWFNPALILNDCWPQWDCWILPSFIFALYCSMRGWWMITGVLLGIGAMLKGQMLFVAPIFILWPLFSGQWVAAIRVVAGFTVSFTAICMPWMLTTRWNIAVAAIGPVLAGALLCFRGGWRRPVIQALAAFLVAGPAWLTPVILHGDLSWLVLPYQYGAVKHSEIATMGTSNLPAILHEQWGWDAESDIEIPLPGGRSIETTLRAVLSAIYAVTLAIASIGTALQWRWGSDRFLVAMYSPWVLFFALLPYLNNRYLLWGAALFPLLFPAGVGMSLLGVLICLCSCAMFLEIMCRFNADSNPSLASFTHGLYPGLGFAVVLIAGILLFNCFSGGARAHVASERD